MTGRYPFRYGFQVGVVRPWAQYGLPLEERMLPQVLREAGYETAIAGKWHLGHFERAYLPTRRGFDHQYGHYNGALDYFTHIRDDGFDWHRDDQACQDQGYSTELIGREAVRVIDKRNRDKPLFLYVPFNAVHAPLQVPERFSAQYPQFKGDRRTYAGMVTAMDEAVGLIVAALERQKMLDSTLIVFSSDNGGPHPGEVTSNGPLRGGNGKVYEGGVRVCALAAWKGHIPAGSKVEKPLHMVAWYPTLIDLAGAPLAQKLPLDGHDCWQTITSGTVAPDTEIAISVTPQHGALRRGDWKLVVNGAVGVGEDDVAESKAAARQVELFNLANDLGETKNVAAEHPEIVTQLMARYQELAKAAVPPKTHPRPKGFRNPKVWGEG
jgi:arylsulfatase A-like enzyme